MMNSSNPNLTPLAESDLELLSAYLDNQLSVAERVGLERRLADEPRLRSELEDLRATTATLRALEPVRPPRSFTLDPATAPRRRPLASPFAWVMQMGSGLAGLALVLLATVQMLGGRPLPAAMPASAPAAMATEAPFTMMEAPQDFEAASQASEAPAMAMPTAAPAAAEMRQPEATAAPAATSVPAADSMAAPAAAPTVAAAAAEAAPEAPKEPGADTATDAAGGVAGGPQSNSPSGGGAPPAADQMVAPSIQASDSTPPDTVESAVESAPAAAAPMTAAPWLTLAAGVALLAVAVGLNLASRRR